MEKLNGKYRGDLVTVVKGGNTYEIRTQIFCRGILYQQVEIEVEEVPEDQLENTINWKVIYQGRTWPIVSVTKVS